MQFFECATVHDRCRRLMKEHGEGPIQPATDWYDFFIKEARDPTNVMHSVAPAGVEGNTLVCLRGEKNWWATSKPYYKIFPKMASMMSEVSLEIPVTSFEMPYQTFVILLADDEQNDFWEDMMVIEKGVSHVEKGPKLKWLMVHEFYGAFINNREFELFTKAETGNKSKGLYINYEFEGEWRGQPQQSNYTLSLDPGVGTIEKFFDTSYELTKNFNDSQYANGEYRPSKEMVERIVRLAVATAFFGVDRHEVVMPDIPRKKLEKRISNAGGDVKKALTTLKAELTQTNEWTIGREISLPRPLHQINEDKSEEGGRSLKHSYLKRGHMRWQVCGEGRKNRKLIFIHPHMVKPDLPFAPVKGFRIPDSILK